MNLFKIPDIEKAEAEILNNKGLFQNFPATIDFPFPERYKKIVTRIRTIELASEAILFSSVESVNENKESGFREHWCFAANGQGDRWFLDRNENVFFYDHDEESLKPMDIHFDQWLQMAFIIHQLDRYFDELDEIPEPVQQDFYAALNGIHPGLSENYPFRI